jgi:chromosome segregation ATPase
MEARVSRLEEGMRDVQSAVGRLDDRMGRLEERMGRLEERMSRIELAVAEIKAMLAATLPHLATKAEVAELRTEMVAGFADMPGKTYMWGILAVLLTAYACGLAGLAVLK